MGRRALKDTSPKKKFICQQTYEKCPTSLYYQESVNQKHDDTTSNLWEWLMSIRIRNNMLVKKKEPFYTAIGNVNWFSCYGKLCSSKHWKWIFIYSSSSIPGYLPRGNKNINLNGNLHFCLYCLLYIQVYIL